MAVHFNPMREPTLDHTPPGMTMHPVGWGQTLGEIAGIFGVSVNALMQANPEVLNPDVIYYGQSLRIPQGQRQQQGQQVPVPANYTDPIGESNAPGLGEPGGPGSAVQGKPDDNTMEGRLAGDGGRSSWYMQQPGSWQCGPTSLTMLMADLGMRPSGEATMSEMVRLTGAAPGQGVPGNASLIANAAEKVGLNGKYNPSSSVDDVRAALQAGHKVILNGSLRVGGHFIYVAGINKNGDFIIGDPARPQITTMTAAELQHFATHNAGAHPPGFAEIWR